MIFKGFGEEPNRFGVRNGISEGESQKIAKRDSIPNLQFRLLIGQIVHGFQNEHLEHKHGVERWPAGVGEAIFIANGVEVVSEDFKIDDCFEFWQKSVDFVDFVELIFDVEERELTFGFAHGDSGNKREMRKNTADLYIVAHFHALSSGVIPLFGEFREFLEVPIICRFENEQSRH